MSSALPRPGLGRELGRESDRGLQRAILAPGTIDTATPYKIPRLKLATFRRKNKGREEAIP
jgi:hypothetical protein